MHLPGSLELGVKKRPPTPSPAARGRTRGQLGGAGFGPEGVVTPSRRWPASRRWPRPATTDGRRRDGSSTAVSSRCSHRHHRLPRGGGGDIISAPSGGITRAWGGAWGDEVAGRAKAGALLTHIEGRQRRGRVPAFGRNVMVLRSEGRRKGHGQSRWCRRAGGLLALGLEGRAAAEAGLDALLRKVEPVAAQGRRRARPARQVSLLWCWLIDFIKG